MSCENLRRQRWLIFCCWGCWLSRGATDSSAADSIDVTESEQVLAPGNPVQVSLAVGQSQFLRFTCDNGPADAIVYLTSYSENADPLLFLSVDPDEPPNFAGNDASSFAHWLEDSSGHHYATIKGVSPQGGMLGLFNMRKFASEDLDAVLTLRCSAIIAFDALFWDHLTTSGVCPIGIMPLEDGRGNQAATMCSGHGECEKDGECSCDSSHSGPACEHKKYDVVGNQDFQFDLGPGQYQYFRVHIPPRFAGGYIQVTLKSSMPMVLLLRSDSLPSKTNYDLSNFDDWVNHRNQTDLKFMVPASKGTLVAPMGGIGGAYGMNGPPPEHDDNDGMGYNEREDGGDDSQSTEMPGDGSGNSFGMPAPGLGRRRLEDLTSNLSEASSWPDFFRQTSQRQESQSSHTQAGPLQNRRLAFAPEGCANLQQRLPRLSHGRCNAAEVGSCSRNCMDCLRCVQSSDNRMACSESCQVCMAPTCNQALAACASDTSCLGPEASKCADSCGPCMSFCLDIKDRRCELCQCCESCLPLSAKCHGGSAWESRYAFIAVYHHRRYAESGVLAQGKIDIALEEDKYFVSAGGAVPKSWTSDLYDTFLDLRHIDRANSDTYPDGEQFMYDLEITQQETVHQEVRLFRDRLTLLHLKNVNQLKHMSLAFKSGPKITHVLTASKAAPKTLFDFDDAPLQASAAPEQTQQRQKLWRAQQRHTRRRRRTHLGDDEVVIHAHRRQNIWCAVFSKENGYVQVTSVAYGSSEEGSGDTDNSFAVVLLFGSICGFLMLRGGKVASLLRRLFDLPTNLAGHRSTESISEGSALQGYSGSDAVDQSVEDKYLHRGGLGDEGL
eukprot:TRINITY_DN4524_c0_g2_i1.p1 TRINITY_DN4524_c0_g2~~TRINITY_DN4524_c0_g2_i1.p1  ORF type:complete len:836 (-),score=147.90 TRINITY_DN4524_c0_g2_i1:159-2666(-)